MYHNVELWGVINSSNVWTIRQHVKLLPKHCCKWPPCAPQVNTFSIYAGLAGDSTKEIMRADEVSDDCNRCCCKPYHPLRLEFRQYIPIPGDGTAPEIGFNHLRSDYQQEIARWNTPADRQVGLHNMYQQQPVLFSVVRDDGQRCGCCPMKWLNTFVCSACCMDGVHVYAGKVEDGPKKEFDCGRPYQLPEDRLIGSVLQPKYAGCVRPTLELNNGTDAQGLNHQPFGRIVGPCCFGGMSELCLDFRFYSSLWASPQFSADIAMITRKAPQGVGGFFREMFTDADTYTVEFNPSISNDGRLTPSQKLTTLSAQVLIDYMLFDGNTKKCDCNDNGLTIYCFYCSVIGCAMPCCIHIPKGN